MKCGYGAGCAGQLDRLHNEQRNTEKSWRETIFDGGGTEETKELDWSCSKRRLPTKNGPGRKTTRETPERKTTKEDAGLDAEGGQ